MPFGDGTGPAGLGPMTGRAAGYCAGYVMPGFMNPIPGRGPWGPGRGFGRGWGRGRGWRNTYFATGLPGWARAGWGAAPYVPYGVPAGPLAYGVPYPPQPSREEELDWLKSQAEHLKSALEDIRAQMAEIESESRKEEK